MLYGRDPERDAIGALLDAARAARSGVLVVRGVAGIGKTALLADARDRASDMQVLVTRGVESESELSFAGLHGLLRPVLPLVEALPEPQAAALRGALGLGQPGADRFLISVACLSLLAEAAERHPVLCLVDDLQWLDQPSRDTLLFVVRRLGAEGVAVLLALRGDDGPDVDTRGLPEVALRALGPDAAATLVARAAHGDLAPSVRDLVVHEADGNPLALLELSAGLSRRQLAGTDPLPETLPLAHDVERLFLERVRRLPAPTQQMLLLIAASDAGRLAPVMGAAEVMGVAADALTPAEDAGLVEVRGTSIEVRHPLVRSAIYQAASSHDRRRAHLALADAMPGEQDADQRAWHHALAAVGPDAGIADELERTADRARRRSGHAAAATALQRAAELSVDDASRGRRLVAAARAAWQAGHSRRAARLVQQAIPLSDDPRLRAELLHVEGQIGYRCGSLRDAVATLLDGADEIAPRDPRKALDMVLDGCLAATDCGDYDRVVRAGDAALRLPLDGDPDGRFLAALIHRVGALLDGRPGAADAMREVLGDADDLVEPRRLLWAAVGAGLAGEHTHEVVLLRRAAAGARASGAVDTLAIVLEGIAVGGVISGRSDAATDAAEGLSLAVAAGLPNSATLHRASLAWFAAIRGDDEQCRALAAEVQDAARPVCAALANAIADWSLATLDLARGRPAEAATRLTDLLGAPVGVRHPLIALQAIPDLVEAAVRCDLRPLADEALPTLQRRADPEAPAWLRALAARCRGLLADGDEAERELREAVRLLAAASRPFDLARTELLLGEHLRRARQRVDAREHLRAALEAFDSLGAAPWSERARVELRASGETARKRDLSAILELTPQELQVARLVAQGLSNREIAAQLFLSPRTIDAHLRGVFAKLGLTSRRQLAQVPLGGEPLAGAVAS